MCPPPRPQFRLTETPSLPGAPGAPLGPGLPGGPVTLSIPSAMVGHTSHGSPCPVGTVRRSPGLGGSLRWPPRCPEPRAQAPQWRCDGRRCMPVPPPDHPDAAPTLSPFGPRMPGGPCGRKAGEGAASGDATQHPQPLTPAMAWDGPSPSRGHQLSQPPLCAWALIPPLLQPSSPDPEPRNPSLTPGFGSRYSRVSQAIRRVQELRSCPGARDGKV